MLEYLNTKDVLSFSFRCMSLESFKKVFNLEHDLH